MTTDRHIVSKTLIELYDGIIEEGYTPQILVYCDENPSLNIPAQFVHNNHITLLISPKSVRYLEITHTGISFTTRFNQIETEVYVPLENVRSLFTRENNDEGLPAFYAQLPNLTSDGTDEVHLSPSKETKVGSKLKVIDGGKSKKQERTRPTVSRVK